MARLGLLLILCLAPRLGAQTAASEPLRGTKVEWARLKSDSPYWDRHGDYDSVFLDYMRANTSLDIDPVMRVVSAASLDQLCAYPFIFVANAESLPLEERKNLAEYLRRGGFILMDLCLEPAVHPDLKESVMNEVRILLPEFPHLHVVGLRPDHPIYTAYFDLSSRLKDQHGEETDKTHMVDRIGGLAGIYDDKRMIGILSVAGLECDLAGFERFESAEATAQIMTNIYIYALTGNRAP